MLRMQQKICMFLVQRLALVEMIKSSVPEFQLPNGDVVKPCQEFDQLCQGLAKPSIKSFKTCLDKNLEKKKGDDKCIEQLVQKGIGHLAFNLSDLMIDDYIEPLMLDYLCLDKPVDCDERGCSRANCRTQAQILLKAKAKKQINKCFKNYDPIAKGPTKRPWF